MLQRILNSVRFRKKWAKLGVRFGRSSSFSPKRICVNGCEIDLSFPTDEERVLKYELGQIYYDDCYWLEEKRKEVRSIIDVGGNIGLFSIIARHHFPLATIHCYEPNPAILSNLSENLGKLGVRVFSEAVGASTGYIELDAGENSLHSTAKAFLI